MTGKTVQVVIEIPEEVYKSIRDNEYCGIIDSEMYNAIANGTPLPKGHGDLKDVDALKKSYGLECATKYGNASKEQQAHSYDTMMMYEIADMLDFAPTIIEADKEEAEE